MKKFLSVLMTVMIIVTSCVCALTVFAADCTNGHNVTSWYYNNKKNHLGFCEDCGASVKKAHDVVVFETVEATCTQDGYTRYVCNDCSYAYSSDTVSKTGHDVISTTYNYDLNGDGVIDINDSYQEVTVQCRNEGCDATPERRNLGAANRCPECKELTLLSKLVVEPTCQTKGYTSYVCSTPGCAPVREESSDLAEHKYRSELIAPTCTSEGYTRNTCIYCGGSYNNAPLPAKGHSMDEAGAAYIYTYNSDNNSCTISGYCSDCGYNVYFAQENTPAEKCMKCSKNITSKTVKLPENCEESAEITITCSGSCGTYNEDALPVGHSLKTATYIYNDNGTVDVSIECNICDATTTSDKLYLNSTSCTMCAAKIEKRVVVTPTCTSTGHTKVTCPECGVYTEEAKVKLNHDAGVAEWTFDHDAGVYIYSASCERKGCNGYTFESAIGIADKCDRCGKNTLTEKRVVYSNCTTEGYTEAECSYCGTQTPYNKKSVTAHNLISEKVNATCEDSGYTKSTCKDCLYTKISDETEALGHAGGVDLIVYTYNADGTSKKTTTGYCERCNALYTVDAPISGNENKCAKCGVKQIKSKTVVDPRCYSNGEVINGYTRVDCLCGEGYETDIITASHSFGQWITIKAASCINSGIKERKCNSCGFTMQEDIPANTTTDGQPKHQYVILVPAVPATCTTEGKTAQMYCELCGNIQKAETVEATGHIFDPNSTNKDFCSRCNSYVIGEGSDAVVCDCICHNDDGLAQFFFRFLCFFYQLFGIEKTCDCGKLHY